MRLRRRVRQAQFGGRGQRRVGSSATASPVGSASVNCCASARLPPRESAPTMVTVAERATLQGGAPKIAQVAKADRRDCPRSAAVHGVVAVRPDQKAFAASVSGRVSESRGRHRAGALAFEHRFRETWLGDDGTPGWRRPPRSLRGRPGAQADRGAIGIGTTAQAGTEVHFIASSFSSISPAPADPSCPGSVAPAPICRPGPVLHRPQSRSGHRRSARRAIRRKRRGSPPGVAQCSIVTPACASWVETRRTQAAET